MDAIEDTHLAIDSYLKLHKFTSTNGGYLYIYGVLQAINIQQDAISNLSSSLLNNSINYKQDYPQLYEIREHRNNSIGHPTKRGADESFHYIDRSSISKETFTLASFYPKSGKKSEFQNINIIDCIKQQSGLVNQILKQLMETLKTDFETHKEKFKGKKLSSLLRDDLHYEFSKLYEYIFHDYPLVENNFNHIKVGYGKIKEGIEERYFSIDALSGTKIVIDTLEYIFKRLENTLIKNKIDDKIELQIFVDSLKSHFKELLEMAKEIDEEFS